MSKPTESQLLNLKKGLYCFSPQNGDITMFRGIEGNNVILEQFDGSIIKLNFGIAAHKWKSLKYNNTEEQIDKKLKESIKYLQNKLEEVNIEDEKKQKKEFISKTAKIKWARLFKKERKYYIEFIKDVEKCIK